MLIPLPSLGVGQPRLVATFQQYTFIMVQIAVPNAIDSAPNSRPHIPPPPTATVFLSTTSESLLVSGDTPFLVDGLQVNTGETGLFWWQGDLWAAGSNFPGSVLFVVFVFPGTTTSSRNAFLGGYNVAPSYPTDQLFPTP